MTQDRIEQAAATVVAYGGGVNSTALLVGLHERGERPDAIVFADTGGERRETYAHVAAMSAWCISAGFPEIATVRATFQGEVETLEQQLLRTKSVPSLAYGYKRCSQRFKREPSEKWLRGAFPEGEIVKLVGFDAAERHRAERAQQVVGRFRNRYPLIEWNWAREECVEAIKRAGIAPPPKSSCFFCPASKPREIRALPCDLLARALAIEDNAELNHIKGLGRWYSWRSVVEEASQPALFDDAGVGLACECYDGGPSDE
jgi:hypothetical protein